MQAASRAAQQIVSLHGMQRAEGVISRAETKYFVGTFGTEGATRFNFWFGDRQFFGLLHGKIELVSGDVIRYVGVPRQGAVEVLGLSNVTRQRTFTPAKSSLMLQFVAALSCAFVALALVLHTFSLGVPEAALIPAAGVVGFGAYAIVSLYRWRRCSRIRELLHATMQTDSSSSGREGA